MATPPTTTIRMVPDEREALAFIQRHLHLSKESAARREAIYKLARELGWTPNSDSQVSSKPVSKK